MPVETPVNAISRAEQLESHPSLVGRDEDKYHLIALKNAYLEMKEVVEDLGFQCALSICKEWFPKHECVTSSLGRDKTFCCSDHTWIYSDLEKIKEDELKEKDGSL